MKSVSSGSWDGGKNLNFKGGCIGLNSGGTAPVNTPASLRDITLADTKFVQNQGWVVQPGTLKTIVTRAPTHEPYPYHNQGVSARTALTAAAPAALTGSTAATLAGLVGVPVNSPIYAAEFLAQPVAELAVGSLDASQVTGLLAQTRLDVGQAFNEISLDKGIGEYGLTASQLEGAGFLKPGTVQTYLQDPAQLQSVLSSPSVWTGKSGVGTLSSLLADPELQSLTQNEVMVSALDGLRSAGVVTGTEAPRELASFVQTAAKFGVNDTIQWINGAAPPDIATDIQSVAKSAQYAVNFVDSKASELTRGLGSLGGFTNTVDRSAVDQAVTQVIGNPKVPSPDFSGGLYSNTPNSALTYSGDDPIVLERVNQERRRRGLPPLGPNTVSS
jgi:hypothetical protein